MVSIILAASDESKAKAVAAGFTEQTVLIRYNGGMSTSKNKKKLEHELYEMRPYQFLVSDFWGAGPD